jgi:predicted MFS family arabinose efflux permease
VTFSPVLIKQVFNGEAAQFGTAVGAFGLGGLLGGLALLGITGLESLRRIGTAFSLGYGGVVLAVSLTQVGWSVPLLMGLAGLCMAMTNISSNATIQSLVKPELLGQVASLFTLAMRGGMPLGSLATGLSVEYFGVQHTLTANGLLAISLLAVLNLKDHAA